METTGLAKTNPGLDTHHHPIKAPLTGSIDVGLADFIVKKRLFNFFLNDGCIPFTKEKAFVDKLVTHNPWPRPISVFGYDDTWGVEGDLFEAETNCNQYHNMGQIASNGFNNLAYFSSAEQLDEPLVQNPDPPSSLNKSKTYVSLVVGDGDNLNFIKGSRRDWFDQRIKDCSEDNMGTCFPLVWTISPALRRVAPSMVEWFSSSPTRLKLISSRCPQVETCTRIHQ